MSHRTLSRSWPFAAIGLGFLLTRWWVWTDSGIRFNSTALQRAWQVLDVSLLREDLVRSVYHLHSQPPLFNLYLGTMLKVSDGRPYDWFRWTYLLAGLVLALALGALAMRLGAKPWVAAVAGLLFAASPTAILYENWLFYTYPTAMVVTLAALALYGFGRTGKVWVGVVAFGLMTVALYTRGIFHLVWLGATVAIVVWVLRDRRRAVVLAALPAVVLAGALYLKNTVEFGVPASSSWLGMNLSKLTTWTLPEAVRKEEIAAGTVSELVLTPPFQYLDKYPRHFREIEIPPIPALAAETRANGRRNLNHLAYVGISQQYMDDALTLMRHHPQNYLATVINAWLVFLRPPSEYDFLRSNRSYLTRWDRIYSTVVLGASPGSYPIRLPRLGGRIDEQHAWSRIGWITLFLLPACLIYAARDGLAPREDPARAVTLLFIALTIVWVAVVGNLAEAGENNRFRVLIEPLVFAVAAAGASRLLPGRQRSGELPAKGDDQAVGEQQGTDQ